MANLNALRAEIEALEHPVFAVLDGAQFDNLPDALFDGDFVHKPLYLDRGDGNRDQTITAPQLVWLDRDTETAPQHEDTPAPDVLNTLFELIGDKPAAVFWECPDGGEVLYKHLRTINMVMMQEDGPDQTGANDPAREGLVVFRHSDSDVLAQVLPVFDERQFARFFGPASLIVCLPTKEWFEGNGILVAEKPGGVDCESGFLRITAENLEQITIGRKKAMRGRLAGYLSKTAPDHTKNMHREELDNWLDQQVDDAQSFGVQSERSLGLWCHLQALTGGQLLKQKGVADYLNSHGKQTADAKVSLMFKSVTAAAKERGV